MARVAESERDGRRVKPGPSDGAPRGGGRE